MKDWLKKSYGVTGSNLFQCIQANLGYAEIDAPKTLQHRYLYEDIPTGLVPLEAVGKALGMAMPLTSMVIDLANAMVGADFRRNGRNLHRLGIFSKDIRDVLRKLT